MICAFKRLVGTAWKLIHNEVRSPKKRRPRNSANCRLAVEDLENRELKTWSAVPSTFSWPSSVDVGFNSNARTGTASITNGEVDVFNFVAPRSGQYTLTAGQNGSQIDTIAGLFLFNGTRVAGNDDSGGTLDSKMVVNLVAGTRYALAITNHTNSAGGSYKWSIEGPSLTVGATNGNLSSDFITSGRAMLTGNQLNLQLIGTNRTSFSTFVHRIDVYLLDANNRPIHTGSWSLSFKSGGRYVPGLPSRKEMTQTFDLSGWDLRNVRSMRIVAS